MATSPPLLLHTVLTVLHGAHGAFSVRPKINMRSFAHKVAFVTSNIYKVKEIQHLLDHSALRGKFHLTPLKLKTLEIQEDNSVKITRAKLLNAVQQLRVCGKEGAKQFQWVMVEDTSLCINALGGSFHFLLLD